ncbi:MAG TPA: thioesterase family protein [Solirubrobacteraceae bacterium]|nr:thioesterase family protein [Solirubrobacteraceae bacterium]
METSIRIAVRWRDLDMLGHLNQAVYHEYLEEARGALFERSDGLEHFPFVLARVELDHRREIRRDHGHVDVTARVGRIGTKSVTVEQEVVLPDGTVAAKGSSVLVAWDVDGRSPRPLSERERAALGAD